MRHHIIPELQLLNGRALDNIQRMTERMEAVEVLLDDYKARSLRVEAGRVMVRKSDIPNEYLLYELLVDYGFNSSQAAQIYVSVCADSVGAVFSSASYDLLVDREFLMIEAHLEPIKVLTIPETGTYVLNENQKIRVESGGFPISKENIVSANSSIKDADVATLDASKVSFPLTIRRVEEGDWMIPYGMKGRKLLSDLMTDLKMSIFDKRKQLVVVDSKGVIVWAVGLRVGQNVAVPASVSGCLVLRISLS